MTQPVVVIAPATHDTASAVAAVPASGSPSSSVPPDWCYLSSGTWSLLGVEVPHPVINAETMRYNFTNEGGVAGTTRLLKNIMGLWLVQESRRTWARAGREMSYEELTARAQVAPPFSALVDPDDASFLAPGDMPARLAAFCTQTAQKPPQDEGALVRCCLESLALKYRWTIERLESILGTTIKTIHVVGGGTKNTLLCQFTADACGRPVHAGPVEATAIGNILMQAIGRRKLGSIAELRAVVARSFPVTVYEPRDSSAWADAAGRFAALGRWLMTTPAIAWAQARHRSGRRWRSCAKVCRNGNRPEGQPPSSSQVRRCSGPLPLGKRRSVPDATWWTRRPIAGCDSMRPGGGSPIAPSVPDRRHPCLPCDQRDASGPGLSSLERHPLLPPRRIRERERCARNPDIFQLRVAHHCGPSAAGHKGN